MVLLNAQVYYSHLDMGIKVKTLVWRAVPSAALSKAGGESFLKGKPSFY